MATSARHPATRTAIASAARMLGAGLVGAVGLALVEQGERDGQRLLGARDDALVALDPLIGLEDLILVPGRLLLELADPLGLLAEPLVALGDRLVGRRELLLEVGDHALLPRRRRLLL